MKEQVSSMDLVALMQELRVLEGARIDKFYQRKDELIMHVYNPGDKKYRILMTGGKIFPTSYKREMPQKPPGFCMYLRNTLGGAVIERVEQYDFDRIVEFHTEDKVLVCELFGNGNFAVTNKNRDVDGALRTGDVPMGREVHVGEEYPYPEPGTAPGDIGSALFDDADDDADVVVVLAADVGLGGTYAEEIMARTDVPKDTPVAELTAEQEREVLDTLHEVYDRLAGGDIDPRVYSDEDGPVAATPIPFITYDDDAYTAEVYDTFAGALDTYFTEKEKTEYKREQRRAYHEQKEKLERRLDQQEGKMEGLEVAIEENQEKGDLIYRHYSLVEDIIESISQAKEQYTEPEIEERLEGEQAEGVPEAEAIERIDLNDNAVVVDIGEEVRIDLGLGVERNAEQYYEKAKQSREKLEGVKEALEQTRQELEQLEKEDVDVESAFTDKDKKQAEKQWYEKFRWFFSGDGYLVIGGRDTTTNDMLVRKYMENNDIYVHAEFTGAPSVVIKTDGDEDIPEQTLEEAGQFAVTFARSWDTGVTAEDAYWVHPDQVTQEPESGEYLPKGSFVIRGDRTYMNNLPVEAAVGAYERDDGVVAMGGPPSAVEAQCEHYVVVEQGREKPSDVAKTIQSHLHEQTGEDFDLDRIIRALPPGNAQVKEKH